MSADIIDGSTFDRYQDETQAMLDEHRDTCSICRENQRLRDAWKPDAESLERVYGPEYAEAMRENGEASDGS